MKTDGHDELDIALTHLKGLLRASPPEELWEEIERKISEVDTSVISFAQWRKLGVAAVVVLGLNVYALISYTNRNDALSSTEGYAATELVSDYQFYE